jgi:hypothetical protein
MVTDRSGDFKSEVLMPLDVRTDFFWDMTPYTLAKP